MSAREVTTWYVAGVGVLVACFYFLPATAVAVTPAVGVAAFAAILLGVHRNRPRRRYAWWLLGAGLLALAAGDTVYLFTVDPAAGRSEVATAGVADMFYLAMFPLIGMGLLALTRSGTGVRDRAGLLDFLIFTTVGAFLLWVFLVHPYLVGGEFGAYERSMLAGYALADLLVLATTARLAVTSGRSPAAVLLVVGAAGMLIADLIYGTALLDGTWRAGGLTELGWFLLHLCWGAAALHPSMVSLTEPVEPVVDEISRIRLLLLGLAAATAPATLLVQVATDRVRDAAVIAVVAAVVFAMVLSRLADAVDAHRSAVVRERSLRQAGADLVSAAEVAAVSRAVRRAVDRILPAGTAHRTVFWINKADGVPTASMSVWGPTVEAPAAYHPAPMPASARRSRLLRVRSLHPALAGQLTGFDTVVLCPLVVGERTTGLLRVGALLVAAAPSTLPAVRDSLEVLAAQVALALERISLSQEIDRRNSEEYFRSLVRNAADIIMIVDDEDRIRYASPSTRTVFGVEPADLADLRTVAHAGDGGVVGSLLASVRASVEPPGGWVEWAVRRPDGVPLSLEVNWRDLRTDRAVRGFVLTMRDVTESQRLKRELTHRAGHDSLTGLANRANYQDQVYEAVDRARETGRTVGTLSIDLDEFTAVNDTHGHAVGDALLCAVGQRLRDRVGDGGTVARLGGDEFALLVPDADGPDQVETLAADLVRALAEPLAVEDAVAARGPTGAGTVVIGSVSIGVATTADASGAGELLQRADLALYVAKNAGKGRWRRYQAELHTAIVKRLELRTALTEAVEKRSFSLEYQPIVELADGRLVGFEALVRWHHPARGLVPPEQFIALAEETGLIEPIGDWVLEQAVAAAARWRMVRPDGVSPYVSVNVSARQLRGADFVTRVRAALAASGLPPCLVMLEITESLLLRDEEPVWEGLSELRSLGLRVAIDDFGTGFSSLSYLQQMPADVLKIDRSFTRTVVSSRRQRLLVEGIVRLGNTLGLDVIAEGVETEAIREVLLETGCPAGQGYLFSRPLGGADAAHWSPGERRAVPVQRATG